jgi:hypothetical protein
LIFIGRVSCTPDCNGQNGGLKKAQLTASFGGTNFVSDGVRFVATGSESTASSTHLGYGVAVGSSEVHSTGYSVESLRVYRIDRRSKYICLEPALRPAMEF